MKKQVFHDATTGILIGLILSIIFSFIHSPSNYAPLSPNSFNWAIHDPTSGAWITRLTLLSAYLAAIGVLFSFGSRLFAQRLEPSSCDCHSLLPYVARFCTSSNPSRLVPSSLDFRPSAHPKSLPSSTSSSGLFSYKREAKKVDHHQSTLAHKKK